MHSSSLLLLILLAFSCTPKDTVNNTLEQIKTINQLVQRYDEKLHKLNSEKFQSQQEFDSTIVRENFLSFTCFKQIDSQVSCIELGKQDTEFQSTRFYYKDQVLILAIFYKEISWKMKEYGRQYFRHDSLIYTQSLVQLPDSYSTLRVADSMQRECSLKLHP